MFHTSQDFKRRGGEGDSPLRSGPARFRELLRQEGIVRSLGAHDVFSALLVEQAGFETVFIGGFGTSASLMGLPDLNLLTMTEMADAVRRMASRVSIPVVADGDTGHGDLQNVVRTVETFEQAGAAGILLEDQVTPKRCGHFEGKQVISPGEMVLKHRAAQYARSDSDFVIIARTDARAVHGLAEAIDRVRRYCDAGADVAFIEAPESVRELEIIAEKVEYPLLVNLLTGGKTPLLSIAELEQMGYKIAVCPIESLLIVGRAMQVLCHTLQTQGRVDGLQDQMMSFQEVKQLLGVERFLSLREQLQ